MEFSYMQYITPPKKHMRMGGENAQKLHLNANNLLHSKTWFDIYFANAFVFLNLTQSGSMLNWRECKAVNVMTFSFHESLP